MDAQVSSDKIRDIAGKVKNMATYPGGALANNLKLIARLIAGGLPTRVFYLSQGGYDTHTGQLGAQNARLKELADATKAFTDDLTAMGEFQRVTMMNLQRIRAAACRKMAAAAPTTAPPLPCSSSAATS